MKKQLLIGLILSVSLLISPVLTSISLPIAAKNAKLIKVWRLNYEVSGNRP